MKLTNEEKELFISLERNEWKQIPHFEKERRRYEKAARATFRKDKRINIRISEKDLINIQKRAVIEGLPYQTFISSIIHKFIGGRLVEKNFSA